ncbi:MAG: hypothetical protein HY860_02415 [Chlamydiales bacterium]|nr:hypothetical protein [Chlamydiales bacterium]
MSIRAFCLLNLVVLLLVGYSKNRDFFEHVDNEREYLHLSLDKRVAVKVQAVKKFELRGVGGLQLLVSY